MSKNIKINPCHVTFTGGKSEPLHDWYPYLEGYSPEFVRYIVSQFIPDPKCIIDPFCGSGTTPLILSSMNIYCGYCEVNPVMKLVAHVKMSVSMLDVAARKHYADKINDIADDVYSIHKLISPDKELGAFYNDTFGKSIFFENNTFNDILALRSYNDKLLAEDVLLGDIFSVAVISKIVICSLLKRAGDVRYKTQQELSKGVPSIINEISKQLNIMSDEIMSCPTGQIQQHLICDNAKNLIHTNSICADGVITSPPYINGTNYFRNTKLELWYIRELSSLSDLAKFRKYAITAGINDVHKGKIINYTNKLLDEVINKLNNSAYDKRIPVMVSSYFSDMKIVLDGLYHQLKSGATACIDIGDSRYAGIHVPVQEILSQAAEDAGFNMTNRVRLRKRKSKDGSELSQDLLIFRK